ncbi:MAG: methylmalonyl Co-A mutase-associated GTPase MeaB [Hyphomicrobiales bacterium]
MAVRTRKELSLDDYVRGVREGSRAMLARAITLIESSKAEHRQMAGQLLQALWKDTSKSHRIGITGVPGVGKSTLIDQLGTNLTAQGHKVAVLAVDPTSTRSGGSILGDKTRMPRLSTDDNAFIRPSPTSGTLGGVTRRTRETMALCEAAGFDVVIVETVGVGQSETAVSEMVDFFLVLMLPGAGDDLQGIKKGVIEIADMIAVNKADGDNIGRAKRAAADYRAAMHILTPASENWKPPVLTISGRDNLGLEEMWAKIEEHRDLLIVSGEFAARRRSQAVKWMRDMIEDRLRATLDSDSRIAGRLRALEKDVREGRTTPPLAANEIIDLLGLN